MHCFYFPDKVVQSSEVESCPCCRSHKSLVKEQRQKLKVLMYSMFIYSTTNSLTKGLGNSRPGCKVLVKQYVLMKTQFPFPHTHTYYFTVHIYLLFVKYKIV